MHRVEQMTGRPHFSREHWNPGVVFGFGLTIMTACLPGFLPGVPSWLWALGVLVGAALMVASARPFYEILKDNWRGKYPKMLALYGMIICGAGFVVSAGSYFWLSRQPKTTEQQKTSNPLAVAKLAELGWAVQTRGDLDQFSTQGVVPSMQESSMYFAKLTKPFEIVLGQVVNLKDLHYAATSENLLQINIDSGEFTDISELGKFVNLRWLFVTQLPLTGSGIVDGTPLRSLANLGQLSLSGTRVRNIDFISNFHRLKKLSVERTLVDDLSPVSSLTSLEEVSIRDTRIIDLTPLLPSKGLRELTVGGPQIRGLSALSSAENLKKLVVIEQKSIDLRPIASLSGLEDLTMIVFGTPLDTLPLGSLTRLRKLAILGTGLGSLLDIHNYGAIGQLKDLQSLSLSSLNIRDLGFIHDLPHLSEISINQVPITSVEELSALKSLRKIVLIGTGVANVSPLLDLPSLEELTVRNTPARSDTLTELARRGVNVSSQ